MRNASWVIKNKTTGQVICEIFNEALIRMLKPEYEAVPILKHLAGIQAEINGENHA